MKVDIKGLKKELSSLLGIDLFNPKYRDVFKKYLEEKDGEEEVENEVDTPVENDTKENEEKPIESEADSPDIETEKETLQEEDAKVDSEVIEEAEKVENDIKADQEEKGSDEEPSHANTIAEEERLQEVLEEDKIIDSKLDNLEEQEETPINDNTEVAPNSNEAVEEEKVEETSSIQQELLAVKQELLELKGLIKKSNVKGYGMRLDNSDILTEEEKRLKALTGINPRG